MAVIPIILAALALIGGVLPGVNDLRDGCASTPAQLLVEHDGAAAILDPHGRGVTGLPVDAAVGRAIVRGQALLVGAVPGRWHVSQRWNDVGLQLVVTDRHSGNRVFNDSFPRRIELSTVVVSESGRFTLHVQGNNVASSVTILDAATGQRRVVPIRHDAQLAAFAIGVAIESGERCAALSMERFGGPGAETWLIDLQSGAVTMVPHRDTFILGWMRRSRRTATNPSEGRGPASVSGRETGQRRDRRHRQCLQPDPCRPSVRHSRNPAICSLACG